MSRVSSPVGWLVGGLAHYDALPTSRPPLLKERRHRKRKRILSEGGTLACPLLWAQGNRSDILWPPPLWPSSSKNPPTDPSQAVRMTTFDDAKLQRIAEEVELPEECVKIGSVPGARCRRGTTMDTAEFFGNIPCITAPATNPLLGVDLALGWGRLP